MTAFTTTDLATTGFTVRELTHDERRAADPSLAEWLLGEGGRSLLTTYPQIFVPTDGVRSLGVYDGDRLLSHAAVRRETAWTSPGPVDVSLVGIVATDPTARGASLASTLLHRIADDESRAGQDAIVLWSDLWEFYAKLGYAIGGVQAEVEYSAGEPTVRVRRARSADVETITSLHADKPWRIERDVAAMRLLLDETDTDCFVAEREGDVTAYACHGKGVDLDGWWHEFGGSDDEVVALVDAAMHELGQSTATLLVPPYRSAMFDLVAPRASAIREGAVALRKPLTERGRAEFFVDGLDSV